MMAVLLAYFMFAILLTIAVKADYPPPSEDGHPYYSRRANTGPSLAGTSRVSSSFGSVQDWTGADWGSLNAGGHGSARCVDIPSNLTLCRNMEYSQMRLPNLLEHDTLREVSQQASSWVRLLDVRCHADTQVFLCSLFAPVCLDRPVWPCRSLCEAVKSGCEDRMLRYGFPWPDMLRCDQYPLDNDLCIGLRASASRGSSNTQCSVCTQSETYENIIDNYCTSDIVMRVKVEQTVVFNDDLKIVVAKKRKHFKTVTSMKPKEAREMALYIETGARCDCGKLEHSRQSTHFLIMAHKVTDRLIVDSVLSLDQRSKDVTKALKAIRDRNVCRRSVRPPTPSTLNAAGRHKKSGSKNFKTRTTPRSTPLPTTIALASTSERNKQNSGRTGNRRQQISGTHAKRPQQ